jgi:hypothetical protein
MHRDHIGDAVQVAFVNAFAMGFSIAMAETILRISSLVLAIAYTGIKIWQALKGNDSE